VELVWFAPRWRRRWAGAFSLGRRLGATGSDMFTRGVEGQDGFKSFKYSISKARFSPGASGTRRSASCLRTCSVRSIWRSFWRTARGCSVGLTGV
jgi:hypothetical protein